MITGLLSADDSIADSPPLGTVSKPCHGPKYATKSLKGHYWVKQPKPSKEVTSELIITNSSAYIIPSKTLLQFTRQCHHSLDEPFYLYQLSTSAQDPDKKLCTLPRKLRYQCRLAQLPQLDLTIWLLTIRGREALLSKGSWVRVRTHLLSSIS
jgi:hypothetical protein